MNNDKMKPQTNPYLWALVTVISLFFFWGLAISLLDVLNKHFQDILHISKGQSSLVQVAIYGAYFLMALPAGFITKKYSYQRGIQIGLVGYALGAFLFIPAAGFYPFIMALFIMGCGLAIIETSANPYISILGDPSKAVLRLNLAQSFNGLGVVLGPLIGGLFIFQNEASTEESSLHSIKVAYFVIGLLVSLLLLLFCMIKLPKFDLSKEEQEVEAAESLSKGKSLFQRPTFLFAVLAQFFYIGAQASVWGFFINFVSDEFPSISNKSAAYYLTLGMLLYMIGRFLGTFLLKFISPQRLLFLFASLALTSCVAALLATGFIALIALMLCCFSMSIMFPTIFALGLDNLGSLKNKGSSIMIMSIVGGAVFPPIMGTVADMYSIKTSFLIPLCCFLVVIAFAIYVNYNREKYIAFAKTRS
ncbi:L-fucose:H+ symporter permease [Sphingobacteruim zhuxiongii]|nr:MULTISPECIES: L-fucose:H+ symporter permease [unclassified Sphingobacterium]